MIETPSLTPIDVQTMNFRQIFNTYDENFNKILDYLKNFGSKLHIEKFDYNDIQSDGILQLSTYYQPLNNCVTVYVNNVRQWLGEGFEEVQGGTQVRILKSPIEPEDTFVVIIADSYRITDDALINDTIQSAVQQCTQAVKDIKDMTANLGDLDEKLELIDELFDGNKLPLSFNTLTEMKSFDSFRIGDIATTLGYSNVDDGGGATYRIVDSAVSDATEQINAERSAMIVVKDYVTPEQLGAHGDGVTDDSIALQKAINLAEANQSYLQLKNRTYLISQSLTVTNDLVLKGDHSSEICITVNNYPIFNIPESAHVLIRDVVLSSNIQSSNTATAIVTNSNLVHLEGVVLRNLNRGLVVESAEDGDQLSTTNTKFYSVSYPFIIDNCMGLSIIGTDIDNCSRVFSIQNSSKISVTDITVQSTNRLITASNSNDIVIDRSYIFSNTGEMMELSNVNNFTITNMIADVTNLVANYVIGHNFSDSLVTLTGVLLKNIKDKILYTTLGSDTSTLSFVNCSIQFNGTNISSGYVLGNNATSNLTFIGNTLNYTGDTEVTAVYNNVATEVTGLSICKDNIIIGKIKAINNSSATTAKSNSLNNYFTTYNKVDSDLLYNGGAL